MHELVEVVGKVQRDLLRYLTEVTQQGTEDVESGLTGFPPVRAGMSVVAIKVDVGM